MHITDLKELALRCVNTMAGLFVHTITTFIRVQRDPIEWSSGQTWKAAGRLFENAFNVTLGVVDHKGKFFTFTDGNIDYFLYRTKKNRRKESFQLGRIKCPLFVDNKYNGCYKFN